eukprot:5627802-Amphidinium_carterae.1
MSDAALIAALCCARGPDEEVQVERAAFAADATSHPTDSFIACTRLPVNVVECDDAGLGRAKT